MSRDGAVPNCKIALVGHYEVKSQVEVLWQVREKRRGLNRIDAALEGNAVEASRGYGKSAREPLSAHQSIVTHHRMVRDDPRPD